MKTILILLCLIENCIIDALPFKLSQTKKYDFLRRQRRSAEGNIGCMHMANEPGDYKFTSDGSKNICGLYLISPPEKIIELEFLDFNIDCTQGVLAIVDGWEMNNEYFPSPEDHELSLQERYKTFCNHNKPSKAFVASQNVALIQHLISAAGEGFTLRVRFLNSPEPCNVVSTTQQGIHTLKNYGARRNCSVSIIYPETIKLASVDVGVTPKRETVEVEFGLINKCVTSQGADFVEVMGGNSFELNDSEERRNVFCGLESNTNPTGTVIGCQHSVVRLISSGNYYNTATFVYRPPLEEELAMGKSVC